MRHEASAKALQCQRYSPNSLNLRCEHVYPSTTRRLSRKVHERCIAFYLKRVDALVGWATGCLVGWSCTKGGIVTWLIRTQGSPWITGGYRRRTARTSNVLWMPIVEGLCNELRGTSLKIEEQLYIEMFTIRKLITNTSEHVGLLHGGRNRRVWTGWHHDYGRSVIFSSLHGRKPCNVTVHANPEHQGIYPHS